MNVSEMKEERLPNGTHETKIKRYGKHRMWHMQFW